MRQPACARGWVALSREGGGAPWWVVVGGRGRAFSRACRHCAICCIRRRCARVSFRTHDPIAPVLCCPGRPPCLADLRVCVRRCGLRPGESGPGTHQGHLVMLAASEAQESSSMRCCCQSAHLISAWECGVALAPVPAIRSTGEVARRIQQPTLAGASGATPRWSPEDSARHGSRESRRPMLGDGMRHHGG